MITCANCAETALYEYAVSASVKVLYCERHLPSFARKSFNYSPVVATPVIEEAVAPKPKSTKKVAVEILPEVTPEPEVAPEAAPEE